MIYNVSIWVTLLITGFTGCCHLSLLISPVYDSEWQSTSESQSPTQPVEPYGPPASRQLLLSIVNQHYILHISTHTFPEIYF